MLYALGRRAVGDERQDQDGGQSLGSRDYLLWFLVVSVVVFFLRPRLAYNLLGKGYRAEPRFA